MRKYSTHFFLLLFISSLFLQSCKTEMQEHYKAPSWSKGSAWDVLEDRGNYETFLEAATLTGFDVILKGKAIVTVMAPNDESFVSYMNEKNKSSLDDFTIDELTKLIGYHILYYEFQTGDLINFRPLDDEHADKETTDENAGLYYKYRTRSQSSPSMETDAEGKSYKVYHNERLIPVFSYRMFETKGINAKYNYQYFYPNSNWTETTDFNVSEAEVEEYEVISDNGYLYMVDRVIEPLKTIYQVLEDDSEYSQYLDLYNKYEEFNYDETLTTDFGDGDSLFLKTFDPLPDIAKEWPVSNFREIGNMSYLAYSIFSPSNSALNGFFEDFWKVGGYSEIDSVNETALSYLIYNTVYGSSIVFPDEIKSKELENSFGVTIYFDVDEVPQENRVICSNGAFYGLDQLNAPPMFSSVTGPAFQYKNSFYYLYMLDASSLLTSLASDQTSFITLIPTNQQLEASEIRNSGGVLQEMTEGIWDDMGENRMTDIVNAHTVTGNQAISQTGTQVLHTNNSYSYWYVKDGKLTTSVLFNTSITTEANDVVFYDLNEYKLKGGSWSNGYSYGYDANLMFQPLDEDKDNFQDDLAITKDETYPFYQFSELLRNAGLVNSGKMEITFLKGARSLIFIPTNDAITTAIAAGNIPGVETDGTVSDADALAGYLQSYFVKTEDNGITTYPYINSGVEGAYTSCSTTNKSYVNIIDDGSSIKVQRQYPGENGEYVNGNIINVIADYDYLPFAFYDCGIHFINGIL